MSQNKLLYKNTENDKRFIIDTSGSIIYASPRNGDVLISDTTSVIFENVCSEIDKFCDFKVISNTIRAERSYKSIKVEIKITRSGMTATISIDIRDTVSVLIVCGDLMKVIVIAFEDYNPESTMVDILLCVCAICDITSMMVNLDYNDVTSMICYMKNGGCTQLPMMNGQ